MMTLRVLLPAQTLVDEPVTKVIAEAMDGSFTLLPRHIDFVAALVPGLLSFEPEAGGEEFLAVDEGILVKQGFDVTVSTRHAIRGADLGHLEQMIEKQFRALDDRERTARSAAIKMEADLVRRFIEMEKDSHG